MKRDRMDWRVIILLGALSAGLLSVSNPSLGQDLPEVAGVEERRSCDPEWDGAIFGFLPGTLAGMLWPGFAFLDETQGGLSSGETIVLVGGVGALVGFALDAAACHPRKTETSERDALVARIRSGERIPRVSVVTKEGASLILVEPFVRNETLYGHDAARQTDGEEIAMPIEDIKRLSIRKNRTAYVIVGVIAGVVGLYTWHSYSEE